MRQCAAPERHAPDSQLLAFFARHAQTWEACAARELEEETGLRLAEPPAFAAVNNAIMSATRCADRVLSDAPSKR